MQVDTKNDKIEIFRVSDKQDFTIQLLENTNVPAGFASPAADYIVKDISLQELLMPNPSSCFMINFGGDSLIGAGVPYKGQAIFDRSQKPQYMDMAFIALNGEFAIKILHMVGDSIHVISANSKYKPIKVEEGMQLEVIGKIMWIIFEPNKNKDVWNCRL